MNNKDKKSSQWCQIKNPARDLDSDKAVDREDSGGKKRACSCKESSLNGSEWPGRKVTGNLVSLQKKTGTHWS